ncbi:MAG: hypothetical protein HY904_14480 [Deltaproteobacteria bacterium]|nr:hypothetical protein [Deltaproteobacteria bacterium]
MKLLTFEDVTAALVAARAEAALPPDVMARLTAAHAFWVPVTSPSANAFARALAQTPDAALRGMERWRDLAVAHGCLLGEPLALAHAEQLTVEATRRLKNSRHGAHQVDDAAQRLREKLLCPRDGQPARISQYDGRGTLLGFLRTALTRELLSVERRHAREVPLPDDGLLEQTAHRDPELEMLHLAHKPLVQQAFRQAFEGLTEKQRTLLSLAYVHGMTVDDLGRSQQVHRATAARWLARARLDLLAATRAVLQQRLGAPASEVDSILRQLQCNLSLSLGWTQPP